MKNEVNDQMFVFELQFEKKSRKKWKSLRDLDLGLFKQIENFNNFKEILGNSKTNLLVMLKTIWKEQKLFFLDSFPGNR